jgi:1-phosphofructokinase
VSSRSLQQVGARLLGGIVPGDMLAVSGGLAPGLDLRALADLLERARRAGASVCVDCSGEPLRAMIELGPAAVRINEAELTEWLWLTGRNAGAGVESGIRELLAAGVGSAMVSLGAEGALLASEGRVLRGRLEIRGPTHAVGAGDAQLAGWLAVRAGQGPSLERQLGFAMGTAAARLRHELPGIVVAAEAEELSRQVEIAG